MIEPPVTAVYDANILYPAPLRDRFIRLAEAGLVRDAVKRQREGLRNPPKTAEELLGTLESQGLIEIVTRLRQFVDVL